MCPQAPEEASIRLILGALTNKVFDIPSLTTHRLTAYPSDASYNLKNDDTPYRPFRKNGIIEDITRWREDMNFMFEWDEQ